MGFKEWLAKPRLSDEEWRNQMAFVGKGVAVAIGAFLFLATTTDFLDKRAKVLGASGMPVGDTSWGKQLNLSDIAEDPGTCRLNGQYRLRNSGELTFEIEHVLIEVYRYSDRGMPASWKKTDFPASIAAISNTLSDTKPFVVAPIKIGEGFGPQNRLDASFVLDFEVPKATEGDDKFIVTARALGGLPETRPWWQKPLAWIFSGADSFTRFGENDLRIASNTFRLSAKTCLVDIEDEKVFVKTIGWPDP